MPELPEVETIRIGLAKLLPGQVIADVWHDWQKSFPNAPADVARFMLGAKIESVRRRAKVLIIELSSGYSLVIHLKMTGQLIFVGEADKKDRESRIENPESEKLNSQFPIPNSSEAELRFGGGHPTKSLIGELPDKSTRVVLDFTDGSKLFFNDQRKFGWMRLIPTLEVPEIDFMKKVGPEPLEDDFTVDKFITNILRRRQSAIKAVLLDQTVLAGVGNIYADESLWAAKIHPSTPVSKVSKTKLVTLYSALRDVLNLSIEKGGSTDKNYVNAEGKKGSYLTFAQVFRKEGQPCPRCGHEIVKIRVAGRGTHICPKCQKVPK
jgi:formamidopyrimidine-DNA glycosylase